MSQLFDPAAIPTPPPSEVPAPTTAAAPPKSKRKSYYIPVAERKAAKQAASKSKKAELALREGKVVPVPNAKKRASLKKTATRKDATKNDTSKGSPKEAICSFCGKFLSRHSSVDQGMGDVCATKIKLLPKGTTLEDHYEKLEVTELPSGFIKLKDAIEKLNAKDISTYRVLQAIGGDRMLRPPLNKNFKVVILKGTRYIDGACLKNWKDLQKV